MRRGASFQWTDGGTWMIDSGAFSAWQSGTPIDVKEYTAWAKRILVEAPRVVEIIALDVIGNWKASLKNYEYMWSEGVPAIPIYHFGEPWSFLAHIKREFPWKLCIGGAVGLNKRSRHDALADVVHRAWPARIHGLGFGTRKILMATPLHSSDSTNWVMRPQAWGAWEGLGRLRGVPHAVTRRNVRAQLDYYSATERKVRLRWRPLMERLRAELPAWPIRSL